MKRFVKLILLNVSLIAIFIITGSDYPYLNIKMFGAVGDSITDNIAIINQALEDYNEVWITDGIYKISGAILMPSNKKLYLRDCSIKVNAGVIDNVIRNKDSTGNTNFSIIGVGNVTLFHNRESNSDGAFTTYGTQGSQCYKYNTIFILNSSYFTIKGLNIKDQHSYGILVQRSHHGTIDNIELGLKTGASNQAGVGFGNSVNYLNISNISGKSGDDFIALQDMLVNDFYNQYYLALYPRPYNGSNFDSITNITCYKAGTSTVRILSCRPSVYTHDIHISNVHTWTAAYWSLIIGRASSYCDTVPEINNVKKITMDSCTMDAMTTGTYTINIASNCYNVNITNYTNNTGKTLIGKQEANDADSVYVNGVKIYAP